MRFSRLSGEAEIDVSEADPEPAGLLEVKREDFDTLQLSRVNGSHAVVVLWWYRLRERRFPSTP